ncbi:MAG: hypothetical protein IPG07_19330 [Crocinitomicaceae bacterium]|nr:hypothetical protein [Crocinitomicaceae bacterium]
MFDALNRLLDFPIIQQDAFALTLFNIVVFAILYLCGKLFIRFIKKYFRENSSPINNLKLKVVKLQSGNYQTSGLGNYHLHWLSQFTP